MKECPICHTIYNDNLNFCVKDGNELIDKPIGFQQPTQFRTKETVIPKSKTKKKGCLKKIIITAVIVLIGFVILYRYVMNAATYLRAEPNSIIAAKCGGKTNVSIDYDGYIWVINHKPDWVSIDENENDFELTVEPNSSGSTRQGTITIQSGRQLALVELSQNANATFIKPSVTELKFNKSGGWKTVKVETDGTKWTLDYPEFLDVETEEDGFIVRVARNNEEFRQGVITLSEDNVSTAIDFRQAGICPKCHGQGSTTCTICGGTRGSGYGMFYMSCWWCGGDGSIDCADCGGTGEKE